MTKFAELHAQFLAWDTALTQYEQNAQMVMLAFYSGFCQYLGHNPATDGDLITLHAIDPAAVGLSRHVEVDHFSKSLSQDEDGVWQFGFTVTMKEGTLFEQVSTTQQGKEVAIRMPHFGRFYFHIRFTLRDSECNFQNADDRTKSFPYKFIEQTLLGPPDAYIYLAGILETVFRTSPVIRPFTNPSALTYHHGVKNEGYGITPAGGK
jgi:hypothetical protein